MCVWMDNYSQQKNARKKNANVASGRLFSLAIICLLAHKLFIKEVKFFKKMKENVFIKKVVHFTLIYIAH